MKIWTWLKSLSWIVIVGAIITAILMVLGGAKAGRLQRRADHAEKQIEALAHDQTKQGIKKAAKFQKQKDKHKENAAATRLRTEARLEKLGEDDELADIAERFNNRRVRKRAD
jgi:uncharacterized membrane protein YcjF (UPF0283 family)